MRNKSLLKAISELEPNEQKRLKEWTNERLGQQITHRRRCLLTRFAMDMDEQEDDHVDVQTP
ncbi:MAG: hypothetical protein WC455_18075 [Dehalococcoidia bacterium]